MPEQRVAFHQQLRDRLMAVPGITASTSASAPPFSSAGRRLLTAVDGRRASDPISIMTVVVDPAYFHTVVSGLVLGDSFSELDGTPGHEAVIVNRRFADVYLGAGNPIGRHIELQVPRAQRSYSRKPQEPTPPVTMTIVGVSPDIRQDFADAAPIVYLPFRADAPAGVTLIVRGSGGPARVISAVRRAASALDPDLALGAARTLEELRRRSRIPADEMTSQLAKIAGLGLVLSGVGLYSAMAYAVRRRTREIAIRVALGAPAGHVRWLFLRTGAWVVAGGLVLGVPASLLVGRLLQNNVWRAEARDVVTLAATVAVLAVVALVASVVPARRAARVDPTAALRIE
jgi:putative ABC transport system permease protein